MKHQSIHPYRFYEVRMLEPLIFNILSFCLPQIVNSAAGYHHLSLMYETAPAPLNHDLGTVCLNVVSAACTL